MNFGNPNFGFGSMGYGPVGAYSVANAGPDVRANFIRKVYSLFFASLLLTIVVGWLCTTPALLPVAMPLIIPLGIADFVLVLVLSFWRGVSPIHFALYYLFAAINGAIIGPVLMMINQYAPGVPAQAAIITAAVFGGLTFYAFVSGKDFSYMGGILFAGLIGLVVAGFAMFFIHSTMLATAYAMLGVLIFSGFILYDTSMIIRRLTPNDTIVGAISLYLDLLNLFWMILQLLMEFQRRD